MNGLARILKAFGASVQGSDENRSPTTIKLVDDGIRVMYGHAPDNLLFSEGILPDMVVYTAAVKVNNPEIVHARNLNIPVIERKDMLGQIMSAYEKSIAVCGTHGKTTTTSMISTILLKAGWDPGIHIGGILREIGGSTRPGSKGIFVTEACEYVDSFLSLKPFCAVVLNIEEDHLDFFKGIEHIKCSFVKFLSQVNPKGYIIANSDDNNVLSIIQAGKLRGGARIVFYGTSESNYGYCAKDIGVGASGCPVYRLVKDNIELCEIELSVIGKHNISNSVAAAAACIEAGLNPSDAAVGLSTFSGASKRFEYIGTRNGVEVYDDYAHHPTEIYTTLSAARDIAGGRVFCIFQPHTYTRARLYKKDFSKALSLADRIILADIYASREANPGDIFSSQIVDVMKEDGLSAVYISSFEEIAGQLVKETKPGDIIITMGAGDIIKVADIFLSIPIPS